MSVKSFFQKTFLFQKNRQAYHFQQTPCRKQCGVFRLEKSMCRQHHKCIRIKDAVIASEQYAENTEKANQQKQNTASERIPIRHAVSPDNDAENAKRRKTDKPDAADNAESFRNSHAFPIRIFFVFSVKYCFSHFSNWREKSFDNR